MHWFVQVYKILKKNRGIYTENQRKQTSKYGILVKKSLYCTKMTVLIRQLTNIPQKSFSKILTFSYLYGKISRLNARRSERLLRCLTAMVHVGNFRGARWFTRQQMWGRVYLPLGNSEADHLLAFIRTGSPRGDWFGFVKWVMETHGTV